LVKGPPDCAKKWPGKGYQVPKKKKKATKSVEEGKVAATAYPKNPLCPNGMCDVEGGGMMEKKSKKQRN